MARATDAPNQAMQVGAYRRRSSASDLRDRLAKTFDNVWMNESASGGESIYRVRVGVGGAVSSLSELKRQLVDRGYPCFAVTETR